MSDILGWFNPTRWIILAVMVGGLVLGFLGWEHHERGIGEARGRAAVQAQWDAAKAQQILQLDAANKAARAKEQSLQHEKDEAVNGAQKQTQLARKDAAAAHAVADGLSGDLAAARSQLASASEQARAKYSAAVDTVFADCTRRYLEMAEAAQGHAIDSLMYQQAWPK